MTGKWTPDDKAHGPRAAGSTQSSSAENANGARPDRIGAAESDGTMESGSSEERARLLAENAELKDRLLRALADVENTRRRAARDLDSVRQYGITKFAGDMLNVADNLERAIASIPANVRDDEGALKKLVEGFELTEMELLRSLEKHGVKKLVPLGERFDPNLHEALFEVSDPSVPQGTVKKVLQPGYTIGGRSLRPAKVGISGSGPKGYSGSGA